MQRWAVRPLSSRCGSTGEIRKAVGALAKSASLPPLPPNPTYYSDTEYSPPVRAVLPLCAAFCEKWGMYTLSAEKPTRGEFQENTNKLVRSKQNLAQIDFIPTLRTRCRNKGGGQFPLPGLHRPATPGEFPYGHKDFWDALSILPVGVNFAPDYTHRRPKTRFP